MLCSVLGMVMMASSRDLVEHLRGARTAVDPRLHAGGVEQARRQVNEAGVKYYLLGVFASAVLLYGMSLLYGATGSTQLTDIGALARRSDAHRTRSRRRRVRAVRIRLQDLGGAVPHVGTRHLRGRTDTGHRVLLGGVEGGRFRGDHDADVHRLPRRHRRLPTAAVGAVGADDDRRQRARAPPDEHRAHAGLLVGQPGRVHPDAAGVRRRTRPRRRLR